MIIAALQEPPLRILIEHSSVCQPTGLNSLRWPIWLESVFVMVKIDKAHLRGIWGGSECRFRVCRFTSALVHTTFHLFDFTFPLPHGSVIAGLWIVSSCCQEIVALAARALWSRGSWLGGASVSALCCVASQAHRLRYGFFVICVCLVAILWVIQCYHLFWYVSIPINWPADHQPCRVRVLWGFCCWFCVLCVFGCCFCFCWFSFCFARWQLNGLCIDPIQLSFWCTLSSWWCCHCINSVNLQNATGFPAW